MTQERKGNGSHNSSRAPPEAHLCQVESPQPYPHRLGAQAGRALLPPLPTVSWGHRAAASTVRMAQVVLPRSETMMQKPP